MKVKAYPRSFGRRRGYDLAVMDPEATVQDYLNAVNQVIEEGELDRGRVARTACEGCPHCCGERIPLTSIDVGRLLEAGEVKEALGSQANLNKFLGLYGQVIVEGRAVDIILGFQPDGQCLFLDPAKGKCRVYPWRPLVCQTFICAPCSQPAKVLRERIVNTGEDQLVREWLLEARDLGIEPVIHFGDDPEPRLADWPETPFAGKKAYHQLKLKDLCSGILWTRLYRPE